MIFHFSFQNIFRSFLLKILLFIIFSTVSCQSFLRTIDDKLEQKIQLQYVEKESLFCDISSPQLVQILGEDQDNLDEIHTFFKILKDKKINLLTVEKAVLLALIQMNLRPDQSSPSSSLQISTSLNSNDQKISTLQFQTTSELSLYPYLSGLNYLLKEKRAQKSLAELYQLFWEYYSKLLVPSRLEIFLKQNELLIKKNPILESHYVRGKEILKKGERLNKFSFSQFQKINKESQNFKNLRILGHEKDFFDYQVSSNLLAKCNLDLSLYDNKELLINSKNISANQFGFIEGKEFYFFTSHQLISEIVNIPNTSFIKGISQSRGPTFCHLSIESHPHDQLLIQFSESRDPGQLIKNLLIEIDDYIKTYNTILAEDIAEIMKYPRYITLNQPVRIILEDDKSNSQKINQFLDLGIPIYGALNIGLATAYLQKNISPKISDKQFIIDHRPGSILECY
jgi:hypothetical protein